MSSESIPQDLGTRGIPEALASRRQWVGWRYGEERPNGKRGKIPTDPRSGWKARVNDSGSWGTLEEALRGVQDRNLDGLGFVLTGEDPVVFVDLDGCRDPETGELAPWASKIIRALDSYTEVSPSGDGVHVYALGHLPGKGSNTAHVEMYDRDRFFTVTGDALGDHGDLQERQSVIERLYARISHKTPRETPEAPREVVPVPLEDHELLEKARAAANGAKFRSLYDTGDVGSASQSEADMALCGILAFWTGRDPARIERMFGSSALGQRAKWRTRPEYRRDTIGKAIAGCEKVYDPDRMRTDPSGRETLRRTLDGVEAAVNRDPWTGRGGPTDKHMVCAFVELAREHGTPRDEGVEVYAARRSLALIAGVSDPTSKKSIKRLLEDGRYIKAIEKGKGRKGTKYLILGQPPVPSRVTHKRDTCVCESRVTHKETPPPCVHSYGEPLIEAVRALLRRWRNPSPQTELDYDRNGRKIAHGTGYLKIPRGKGHALVVEAVANFPGMDLGGLAVSLERETHNVARMVRGLIEDGFIFEDGGNYFVPRDLEDRLLAERLDTGAADREKRQRDRHAEERQEYEEYLRDREQKAAISHEERLAACAAECGAPQEDEQEPEIESEAEVFEMARDLLPKLSHPEDAPYPKVAPGHDPFVHRGTEMARFYRGVRERDLERREREGLPPWIRLVEERSPEEVAT